MLDFYTDYIDANETILLDTSVSQPTNIVFDSNGGSHVPTISGEPGATVTPPPIPFAKDTPSSDGRLLFPVFFR